MTMSPPAANPSRNWLKIGIIGFIVAVVICLAVSCVAFVIVPAVLGPSVANTFSTVLTSMPPTPTP